MLPSVSDIAQHVQNARVPIQPIANLVEEDAAAARIMAALYGRIVRRQVVVEEEQDDFVLV